MSLNNTNWKKNVEIVYILDNKGSLEEIGYISDKSPTISFKETPNYKINFFNHQLLNIIKDDNGHNQEVYHIIKSGDILGLVFYVLRWRRCTGYLVIQSSSKGIRYLCYLYNKIKHTAASFGTNCSSVKLDEIKLKFIGQKAYIIQCLRFFSSQTNQPNQSNRFNKGNRIQKINLAVNNIENNFDELFGI
jgi:hypothetical protein